MVINLVCSGKMKESYYKEACDEYVKMLSRFAEVRITEVQDEPLSRIKSLADETASLDREADRILGKLTGYVIVMDLKGRKMDSEAFAGHLEKVMTGGSSVITFVIGSSLGLSGRVKAAADMKLSFSDMTMPHRLFRVVLLEQLFRAYKIMNGETYHK